MSGNIVHPISDHLPQFAILKAPSFQSTPATSDSFVLDWNNGKEITVEISVTEFASFSS